MNEVSVSAVEEAKYCDQCPLKDSPYVVGHGYSQCPLMVVGAAPGEVEELTGIAFTGPMGQILRDVLDSLGVEPYYTNVLKRRPPNNRKPRRDECWKCGSHLIHEVLRSRPKLILLSGSTALSFFLGSGNRLSTVHGLPIDSTRFGLHFRVLPTFDPSWMIRSGGMNSTTGESWLADLEEFARLAKKV